MMAAEGLLQRNENVADICVLQMGFESRCIEAAIT
jgi:hypothetical protein